MEVFRDQHVSLDIRVEDLLTQLTLEEKVQLLAGSTWFQLNGVERLGVPRLSMTDGPTGIRSLDGRLATVFPVGVALASTWNPETVRTVAAAIASEAQALGHQVVLAPTVNIMRLPTWGRNFETYSEDPFLSARIGLGYVEGLQSRGIGASLKHFAAHNQELERFEVDARLDERTLREIYLFAFETIVHEGDPWTVMTSYNRVNGWHASENPHLLTELLKEAWGFEGVAVSDWMATRSTVGSAEAGLDLEMPGPGRWFGDKLLTAVKDGAVSITRIDDSARRILRLILRSGVMDGPLPPGELRSVSHRTIALSAACEAMTLLKNDRALLPLDRQVLRRIAIVGPNSVHCRMQGGGSSHVPTDALRTLEEALRDLLGPDVELTVAEGVDSDEHPPIARRHMFSPTHERALNGLRAQYFSEESCQGDFSEAEPERGFIRRVRGTAIGPGGGPYRSFRWSGIFWPERTGEYEFSIRSTGSPNLIVDDVPLIRPETAFLTEMEGTIGGEVRRRLGTVWLEEGAYYEVRIDYTPSGARFEYFDFGVRHPVAPFDTAVEAARSADVAILVLGAAATTESEVYDRANMELPGQQNELAEAVLGANPNTVVVMNAGAAFEMPWLESASTVLQMWLPGEAGPDAIAKVLFGEVEPGGRLPMTWPARFGDHPAHVPSADPKVCDYSEGLFVGYRYYDGSERRPAFPFGHGLGYTQFEFRNLVIPEKSGVGDCMSVALNLTNVGCRPGAEVVQVYVGARRPRLVRPPKELKAFAKVTLDAGESRDLSLSLPPRAFAFFDPEAAAWVTEAGEYDVHVGRSASDILLSARVILEPPGSSLLL